MDEVAQVELGGVHGGGQLHAKLLVGVVEDELVVAFAVKFFGLPAAHGGSVRLAQRHANKNQSLPLNTVRNLTMPILFVAYSSMPKPMKPAMESCT